MTKESLIRSGLLEEMEISVNPQQQVSKAPTVWGDSVLAIVDFEDFWEKLFSFATIPDLVR